MLIWNVLALLTISWRAFPVCVQRPPSDKMSHGQNVSDVSVSGFCNALEMKGFH